MCCIDIIHPAIQCAEANAGVGAEVNRIGENYD